MRARVAVVAGLAGLLAVPPAFGQNPEKMAKRCNEGRQRDCVQLVELARDENHKFWDTKSGEERLERKARLHQAISLLKDQSLLRELAKNDVQVAARIAAVMSLDDEQVLEEMAVSWSGSFGPAPEDPYGFPAFDEDRLRSAAALRLIDLADPEKLCELATRKQIPEAWRARQKLTDPWCLFEIYVAADPDGDLAARRERRDARILLLGLPDAAFELDPDTRARLEQVRDEEAGIPSRIAAALLSGLRPSSWPRLDARSVVDLSADGETLVQPVDSGPLVLPPGTYAFVGRFEDGEHRSTVLQSASADLEEGGCYGIDFWKDVAAKRWGYTIESRVCSAAGSTPSSTQP